MWIVLLIVHALLAFLLDDSTTPVTFWAGNNHGAAIVKLEPLD